LQLKQLLPDRFAGELKFVRQMGDRGGSLPLQSDQNRAATLGQLINSDDGTSPWVLAPNLHPPAIYCPRANAAATHTSNSS
jgi:hypothetical protein